MPGWPPRSLPFDPLHSALACPVGGPVNGSCFEAPSRFKRVYLIDMQTVGAKVHASGSCGLLGWRLAAWTKLYAWPACVEACATGASGSRVLVPDAEAPHRRQ